MTLTELIHQLQDAAEAGASASEVEVGIGDGRSTEIVGVELVETIEGVPPNARWVQRAVIDIDR